MKAAGTTILWFLVWGIVYYALGSLVHANFDIHAWSFPGRIVIGVIWMITVFVELDRRHL